MTDRYYKHKQSWRDRHTGPTYRSPRRRAEAFRMEFGKAVEEFDFSGLSEADRLLFIQWLQGASMRDLGAHSTVKRVCDRCFRKLRGE